MYKPKYKHMVIFFAFVFSLVTMLNLQAHAGHHHVLQENFLANLQHLHYIFVHFPIALITMVLIAEGLFLVKKDVLYDHAAYFMLFATVALIFPTVISGFLLGSNQIYEDLADQFYQKHQVFGLITLFLVCLVATLKKTNEQATYYFFLGLLVSSLTFTACLGGKLAFNIPGWFL